MIEDFRKLYLFNSNNIGHLPEKLSDCIEIALNDLEIVESRDDVVIDMEY